MYTTFGLRNLNQYFVVNYEHGGRTNELTNKTKNENYLNARGIINKAFLKDYSLAY